MEPRRVEGRFLALDWLGSIKTMVTFEGYKILELLSS